MRTNFKMGLANSKLKKKNVDAAFYMKYFGEVSWKENIPIEHFKTPTN